MIWNYSTVHSGGKMRIVSHAARTQLSSPPNTLAGLRECVEKGLYYIEYDISPLSYGDFLLFHNEKLDNTTNRSGPVFFLTRDDRQNLWYLNKEGNGKTRVAHLSQLIELLNNELLVKELQLDLKTHVSVPFTDDILKNLLRIIAPVKKRVRISSCADWAIRRLHELDREVKLGFDPQFFIDVGRSETNPYPPFRQNRFTYRDDHPIASYNWQSSYEYLAARAASLWSQGQGADVWYLRYTLLQKSAADGFNWIEFLHSRGTEVCAWTLNITEKNNGRLFSPILKMQPDRISSDTPDSWKRYLDAR